MHTIIKIDCNDQILSFVEKPKIASGGVDENKIIFNFDEYWEGYSKKAIFFVERDAIYETDIDSENSCVVPSDVTKEPGYTYVSVYGTKDNSKRTSNIVKFKIIQGTITDTEPIESWGEVKERLITAVNDLFGSELTMESNFEDIIQAIDLIGMSLSYRLRFVLLLNRSFLLDLPYDASADDILDAIGGIVEDTMVSTIILSEISDILKNRYGIEPPEELTQDSVIEALERIEIPANIRTSIIVALNEQFGIDIPESSSTDQIVDKIAEIPTYEQGYELTQALKDYAEAYPIGFLLTRNQTVTENTPKIRLPYLHTVNDSFNSNEVRIANLAIIECGIDVSKNQSITTLDYISPRFHDQMEKITITGMRNVLNPYNFCTSNINLQEIYIDFPVAVDKDQISNFYNCPNLIKIGGCYYDGNKKDVVYDDNYGKLDYSASTRSWSNAFTGCVLLEHIRFARKGIPMSAKFIDCVSLSEASVLSIINGLDETKTGQRLTMNGIVKIKMNNWYAKYNSALDKYVSCPSTDEGAKTFPDIVVIKGWILA